jgi:hypothetical protein
VGVLYTFYNHYFSVFYTKRAKTGKKGKDGIKYVVTKRKDGSKYWKKAGSLTKKSQPRNHPRNQPKKRLKNQ